MGFYRLWLQQSLHVFAGIGYLGCGLVLLEAGMKMGASKDRVWSPLGILGPPTWIPIDNPTKHLIAVITQLHCLLYGAGCSFLQDARFQKNVKLMATWYLMQSYIITYQVGLVIAFGHEYSTSNYNLAICGIVYNSAILASATITLTRWLSGNLFDDNDQQQDHVADSSH